MTDSIPGNTKIPCNWPHKEIKHDELNRLLKEGRSLPQIAHRMERNTPKLGDRLKAGARDKEGRSTNPLGILVSWAGLEPIWLIDGTQVIDSAKSQKRQNRSFRRFEVHGGYTASLESIPECVAGALQ